MNLCTETQDHLSSHTPILAVKTPKGQAAGNLDEEEVCKLDLAMVHIGKDGERKVLAQHAVPLSNHYRVSRSQINGLIHANWTWSQVSGLKTMEINSKSYKYVDYAFCELALADYNILIVHTFRY